MPFREDHGCTAGYRQYLASCHKLLLTRVRQTSGVESVSNSACRREQHAHAKMCILCIVEKSQFPGRCSDSLVAHSAIEGATATEPTITVPLCVGSCWQHHTGEQPGHETKGSHSYCGRHAELLYFIELRDEREYGRLSVFDVLS